MLTHIHIKNLTIIEELSLDLTSGLSMITGETGAGKSIWVDAVQLALGARADMNLIRRDAKRGEITLCFDIGNIISAKQWLIEQALDEDHAECIIRRVIERDSRSRCSINGRPVGVNQLHEFALLLLTIHSQHGQQSLLKEEGQHGQVDQFAQLEADLLTTQQLFLQWQRLQQETIQLEDKLKHREAELEWLTYQLKEFKELAPLENEWQPLSLEHQQLTQSEHTLQIIDKMIQELSKHHQIAMIPRLQHMQRDLKTITHYVTETQPIAELLTQADIYLQEVLGLLKNLYSKIEINPEKLHFIEQRLSKIHQLAKKHQVEPSLLWTVESQLVEKINNLQQIDERIIDLQQQQQQILNTYQAISQSITVRRQQAAKMISEKVTEFMQQLGMKGGHFQVKLTNRETDIHPQGQEKISFWVATNPGQSLLPLQKIVSGGELSRIHLALQVVIAHNTEIPTLIFDEVDVGIGGQTAAIVGKLLQQLSEHTQVICITHQPQVAAFGHQHYRVIKQLHNEQTFSQIELLNSSARVEELARMLGGKTITAHTRAHAAELLL